MPKPNESSTLMLLRNFSCAAADPNFDIDSFDHAVDVFKTYLSKRVQFLGIEVALCYDPLTGEVFLIDDDGNVAKMEFGELKRWARCQFCGTEGFVDREEPAFQNASTCQACAEKALIL